MPELDRRRFLQLAGGAAAAGLATSALSESIARAASLPANRTHGSIKDVEHIVVLMQENRSFDHYFGTLRGVRGYGDPHPAMLPNGRSVFHQPNGTGEVLPFRPDLDDLGLAFIQDLDHGWNGGHTAFDGGVYDKWVPTKSSTTMAHLERRDIPFHHALADAFTICDSYHCSLVGPTDPNRYYMWTGWVGNDGKGDGPVVTNDELGYDWTTYPERLDKAGVSWKIYQDQGVGLDANGYWGYTDDPYIGNYGDNSLLYFDNYRNAAPGSSLYEKARTGTDASAGQDFFEILTADVKAGKLPQVSWVVAPEAFTEHPNWPANYGAWYVSKVIDALTSNPDVWSKTALLLTYDENDGFFDHVVPAYPSVGSLAGASTVSTVNEHYTGKDGSDGQYGLGQRVPMLVISPWSTGGWVCSETFDHTSIIRFIEARFGVHEPNITPWRRTVAGDLTAAFDFSRRSTRAAHLPSTDAYEPPDHDRHPDYKPTVPANQALPTQEPGVRPSRALGYALDVTATPTAAGLAVRIRNSGRLGAQLQARSLTGAAPASYTVEAGRSLSAQLAPAGHYDVSLHGPNGFFRRFAGDTGAAVLDVVADVHGDVVRATVTNRSSRTVDLQVRDAYSRHQQRTLRLDRGRSVLIETDVEGSGGWYDLTFTAGTAVQTLAGRVENGRDRWSDPQLG